jgi:hypothetical protein
LSRTQAVRIRLDDRRATRRFDPRGQRPPIRNDARQINLGDDTRTVGRIAGHDWALLAD